MRAIALALVAAMLGTASCHSRRASPELDAAVDPIDKVYARYKADRTWIDPDDESKELRSEPSTTGSFATCAHCDYDICYDDLPIEHRLKIKSDADLVRMVRWLRDPDACVRRVAEDVLWPKLGLGGGGMSVSVQDREGYEFHSLVCALKARVVASKVPYDPKIFDGLMVSLTTEDFAAILHGTWRQDIGNNTRQLILEITSDTVRVTERTTHPDPQWPDYTWSNKFDEVRVNPMQQFEITGRSPKSLERHYRFWPVAKDIVWVAYSNEGRPLSDTATSGGDAIRWVKVKKAP